MKIFPGIDIKNGKCVRLLKGDFNQSTEYKKSPIDQAKVFSDLGVPGGVVLNRKYSVF